MSLHTQLCMILRNSSLDVGAEYVSASNQVGLNGKKKRRTKQRCPRNARACYVRIVYFTRLISEERRERERERESYEGGVGVL